MNNPEFTKTKIYSLPELIRQVERWRLLSMKVVFTNGCFDILHEGHIFSLSEAAAEGDILIVGLNSDTSIQKLKGKHRPINKETARALLLASLTIVDAVVIFEEDTPLRLINSLMPDVIVKGGDYTVEQVVGAREVMANGGRVVINPIIQGVSTTALIEKIQNL